MEVMRCWVLVGFIEMLEKVWLMLFGVMLV